MRTLPVLPLSALLACAEGQPTDEDNLYMIDCQTETTAIGWGEALADGTTPLDRLDAIRGAAPIAGSWADGAAFTGTFAAAPGAADPTITRVVGGVDAARCDDVLELPVDVTLADEATPLLDAPAVASTTPDAPGPLTVGAELADQPEWGLGEALEPGEELNGIYLDATTGDASLEGRIFALAEGDNGEVAWQRQVDILSFAALTR
jgi:hypothetical protein